MNFLEKALLPSSLAPRAEGPMTGIFFRAGSPAKKSTMVQGSLESSNVNPVASAVELVAVQRYAEMMQRALSMFHSEFNRIATEDLPRVNP